MTPEAEALMGACPPALRREFRRLDDLAVASGCDAYVKTIYVGYSLHDEMVAAAYPHATNYELALALPEDFEESALIDATHLTWPTMPVALVVVDSATAATARRLLTIAAERVASGTHDVRRDPKFFIERRDRRGRRVAGGGGE